MFFDLDGEHFLIDGSNLIFKDTAYQGEEFEVFVTQPTNSQMESYRRKAGTRDGLNFNILNRSIWENHVHGWNIKGKGGILIPFNDENKKILFERQRSFVNLIVNACLDRHNQPEEDEKKILETSGDGEQ